MRKLLLGLVLVAAVQTAWSDCLDTTVIIKLGNPGYPNSNGVYDPAATGAINSVIKGCSDATITVRLNIDATESAKFKDTIKLANPIIVVGRSGKTTALTMTKAAGTGGVLDTMFTLVENSAAAPQLLADSVGNQLVLTNFGFARKVIASVIHTVTIQAKGSTVSACHFWMADKDGDKTSGLLDVTADSVLVERCLFRAPPDGIGRSVGVHTGGSANKVEMRANVFFSTGIQIASSGPFHVIANTFCGSRNDYNAIIVGSAIGSASPATNPVNNAVIMHNLFAHKADSLSPIAFSSPADKSDSILRNAWSRGKPNLALALGGASTTPTAVVLNGNSGTNVNTPLPRGFSNYGPNSYDVKDYPLTELRSDPTLARKNTDFGKVFKVFISPNWTGMSDVSTMSSGNRMYFPGFTTPFLAGKTWLTNVKVGAFVDQDGYETPSPLDSGSQGSSLKFQRDTSTTTRIKMTQTRYDANYYKSTLLTPQFMYFFFSNTLSKLTASNDTAALKTAGVQYFRKDFLNDDSLLTVPKEVRTGGDIYVKMLHFRQGQQAPVQSNAVIATVTGFPSFPVNDLAVDIKQPPTSDFLNGHVLISVTRGSEPIDSVRMLVINEAGQTVDSASRPATGAINFTIDIATKGNFFFAAVPVAKIGSVTKAGQPTNPPSGPVPIHTSTSDSVFVTYKAGTCTGADGTQSLPYCGLDSALKDIAAKKGGIIIIKNGSPAVALEDIIIAANGVSDTSLVTITSGKFDENRPIIRGKTREALTITRRNVTLRGFTLEQPANSANTALNIKASGAVIDANIFRATATGAVEGAAVNIEVGGTADVRLLNNVVWGFTRNVQLTNLGSPNVKIINNTFVDDAALANTGRTIGVSLAGTATAMPTIANNFFSGIANPIDSGFTGKTVTLDHNVYTQAHPNLRGLTDAGGLDSSSRVATADVWAGTYTRNLDREFTNVIDCSSLSPCNSVYAGVSANGYSVNVTTDVLGRTRSNKHEVGAFEFPASPTSVLGILNIDVTLVPKVFERLNFAVTGKNFDPDPKEEDSVHVFWSVTNLGNNIDASLAAIPANRKRSYPISKLVGSQITDVADNIEENRLYYFYAALGRNTGSRKLGYAYLDTLTSNVNQQFVDCHFEHSKSACPSDNGIFGVDTGTWQGKFESRIMLNEAVASGTIKLPEFISVSQADLYNLDLTSPLPTFSFNTAIPGLGTAGSKQKLTFLVDMYFTPDLTGLDLFLLPSTPGGLAKLVPYWTLVAGGNGKTRLTFESSIDGPQVYAFGKVNPAIEPGMIVPADATVPVYDFNVARDSAIYHIPVKFKGTGFKTGNPLILVSVIPAGSAISKVVDKSYHSHTLVASTGYENLPDSLRQARLYQHYLQAVAAEGASSVAKGTIKPFSLDSISAADFDEMTDLVTADLAMTAGDVGEVTVGVPVAKLFKDYLHYADKKGKASRSIEVEYTAFDGGKISRNRAFIRTKFLDTDLQISEKGLRAQFKRSTHDAPIWNLYGYPWDEADTGSLARVVGRTKFESDNTRLMRYRGSGSGADAFIAYTGSNNAEMKYDSGLAIWSGSTGAYTPLCASGISLDYTQFSLPLAPAQWNDIAMPFNFPIKWQDVVDTSGLTATTAPAMWHYVDSAAPASKWESVTLASAGPGSVGTVLNPWEGYTVKPGSAITLKFPVMDFARSTTPLAAAKTSVNDGSWAIKLEASDATAGMDLRIGRAGQQFLFPEAPNVPGQDFRVALKNETGKGDPLVSQSILPMDGEWRGHWALHATAAKGAGSIAFRILQSTREVPLWLVDVMHGTVEPLTAGAPVRIGEADLRANDYHLVAGDQAYLEGVLKGLVPLHLLALANYPNPFAGSTLIRYALPQSFGKVKFELTVRDFKGRTVWQRTVQDGTASLSYLWDGRDLGNSPLPAGVYSLSLTAHAPGKPAYRAVRSILRM